MSITAISSILEMDLTTCELTLLLRIAESPNDGILHFPDWNKISATTGFNVPQMNRMLTGLWQDRMISVAGVLFAPIVSETNPQVGIAIGDIRPTNRPVKRKIDRAKPGYIYLFRGEGTAWYKIGISVTPDGRAKALTTQAPFRVLTVAYYDVEDMAGTEAWWHETFTHKRSHGEWFELDQYDVDLFVAQEGRPIP